MLAYKSWFRHAGLRPGPDVRMATDEADDSDIGSGGRPAGVGQRHPLPVRVQCRGRRYRRPPRGKTGEHDHLFGSVTSSDIAGELEARGFTIDRRKIQLDDSIKNLGEFTVQVKLHRDVTGNVKVIVSREIE